MFETSKNALQKWFFKSIHFFSKHENVPNDKKKKRKSFSKTNRLFHNQLSFLLMLQFKTKQNKTVFKRFNVAQTHTHMHAQEKKKKNFLFQDFVY